MPKPAKKRVDPEQLRQSLKLKSLSAQKDFSEKFSSAQSLLASKNIELGKIRGHSSKLLGAGALTGTLLLASPTKPPTPTPEKISEKLSSSTQNVTLPTQSLLAKLNEILPQTPQALSREKEKELEAVFESVIGIKSKATLEGEHLNTTYGYIGAEQHLRRYPGDTNDQHAPEDDEYGADRPSEILKEGIAPGLGAWGYFAPSKDTLTKDLVKTEQWYAVVQTLYLPEWGTRQPYLRDWYKYRKVLIVNTNNGKAVVAAIADAGPAAWTGKHFGGSPEVMDYLGGTRYKKGPVVLFFVDDPENKVPLGPVDYQANNVKLVKT
jgi:hypothetical protein